MGDLDINKVLRFGRKSKLKITKKATDWFIRRYFASHIYCETQMADTVFIAHGGIGTVINPSTIIEDNVYIQHRVTIGVSHLNSGAPKIRKDVFIGAGAIILGDVEIGEKAIIGAGAVVTKNVEPNTTVVGCPAKPVSKK